MTHKRLVTVLRRVWLGSMAIGLAAAPTVVPASFAQDSPDVNQGRSAGTIKRQTQDKLPNGLRLETREPGRVFVAEPIGKVRVGPEQLEGEPIYVRGTTAREGMKIVEVSTTPFMPELPVEKVAQLAPRPDQPAGW